MPRLVVIHNFCDRRNCPMAFDGLRLTVARMGTWETQCRAGHRGCFIPWGYDRDHTDSARPYTLDELAERTEPPHRYAYPDQPSYLFAWRLWRSLRRDARPTEQLVRRWRITALARRLGVPELLDTL